MGSFVQMGASLLTSALLVTTKNFEELTYYDLE